MNEDAPRLAGRKEWIGLSVIALPCLLYSMDLTVLNLALPHLSADLKPSSSELLWIVDIYGFLVAGMLIPMGTLGDRIGRRKLLMIGAAVFGVTSVIAAFSSSAEMLIASRAMLGVAGATLAPSTLSLIRNMFLDSNQRTFAIGIWVASYSVGGAIGPLIGGILLEHFWWGSVFLVAVPVMVLLLIVGPILLPEFLDPKAGRMDLVSAALSLTAVLSAIFGLKRIAEDGLDLVPCLFIAAGIIIGIIFYRRQQKLESPLIDLQLFRLPSFSVALTTYMLCGFVTFGLFLFTFQYLQLVLGLSPLKAGLWSLPSFCGFIIGSMFVPTLVSRYRPGYVISASCAFSVIGFLILTQVDADSSILVLVIANSIFSISLAPVFTLATDIIIGSAPPERAGAASAISETGSELGGALGIAVLGSIGTMIYRSNMETHMHATIPGFASGLAKETLPGAIVAAEQLPHELAAPLIHLAGESFVLGMQLSALIGAVIVTGLAILTALKLKHIKTSIEKEKEEALMIEWENVSSRYQNSPLLRKELFEQISEAYSSGNRHYHNLDHISALLISAKKYKDRINDYDSLVFAIWFHDFVYQSTATDNEEQSAEVAHRLLEKLQVSSERIRKVKQMILTTKNHMGLPEDADEDTKLLLDFDLKILGAERKDYITYTKQIRKEYWLIPDVLFKPGRKKVLQKFLEAKFLFKTNEFRTLYEKKARENIAFEISLL